MRRSIVDSKRNAEVDKRETSKVFAVLLPKKCGLVNQEMTMQRLNLVANTALDILNPKRKKILATLLFQNVDFFDLYMPCY